MAYGILPQDFWIEYAIREAKAEYGLDISIESKDKSLNKFGRSAQVNASNRATLMTLPTGTLNETYITDNLITHVSSDAADTGAMVVEGHTIDASGDFTFVAQTVTLAGTTKTALTTPLARCTRLYNNTTTPWTGTIYAYEDVAAPGGIPGTATAVHCMIRAGEQQSEKASTTLSKKDVWIITTVHAGVLTKAGTTVADIQLETRRGGKVFRPLSELAVSTTSPDTVEPKPYIIIPPNSDVRLTALGSATMEVFGFMRGLLAIDRTQL